MDMITFWNVKSLALEAGGLTEDNIKDAIVEYYADYRHLTDADIDFEYEEYRKFG